MKSTLGSVALSAAVLLVVVLVLNKLLLNKSSVSGFEDIAVPAVAASASLPVIKDYLCRSPNNNNIPCPEGTFCDGSRQVCEKRYIGAKDEESVVGYYS